MPEPVAHQLIRNGRLEDNIWQRYEGPDDHLPPDEPGWMIALTVWQAQAGPLAHRAHPVGIVLPTDAEPGDLLLEAEALAQRHEIAFLAVEFAQYGDGRGMSLAWMLREEYGWHGELRALGDVLVDTVHYLARCGFDSYLTKPGHDPVLALEALNSFTRHYQPAYPG